MNIKDLPQGSYSPVQPTNVGYSGKLNINNLNPDSYSSVVDIPVDKTRFDVLPKQKTVIPQSQKISNAKVNAENLKKKADNAGGILGNIWGTVKEVGNTLSSSEQGLGESLRKIYGGQSEELSDVIRSTNEQQQTIQNNIRIKEKKGQDTTKLKQLYNENLNKLAELNKGLESEQAPTYQKVAGQLGGTALDILTAGQGSKGMQSGKLALGGSKLGVVTPELAKVAEIAKAPKGLFTAKGIGNVAKGAGIGYASDVFYGLQGDRGEDRTGAKAFIPGLGTAIGGGLPAFTEGVQSIKNFKSENNVSNAIDGLEQTYNDIQSGTTLGKKKLAKIEQKTIALNNAGTEGKTPSRVLAENGIIPNRQGPKLDTFEQANQFREKITPLREANKMALTEVGLSTAPIKIDDLEREAISYAKTSENIDSGRFDKMASDIRREFALLKKNYPAGEIPLSKVDDIKSARWDNVFKNKSLIEADVLKKDSEYAIAKAMQKKIEKIAKDAGHTEVAQLNREIGDRLEASKFLEDINGKTVKGGRALKYVTTLIGAQAGNSIPGKIIGALGGNLIGEMIISNTISSPIKRMLLKNLETSDPASYTKTLEWLSKQNLDRETRLMLPAPGRVIELGGDTAYTMEKQAQKVRNYDTSKKPLMLPYPTSKAQGVPLALPKSVRKTNLGY